MAATYNLVLKPRKGWQPVDCHEIWLKRQLLGFLIWRDVKIRYRQTIFGGLWAVFQPLLAMFIFTFFFHRLSGISNDGPPYQLFAYCGLAFWTFFSNAVSAASNSLVGNQTLISKVYFPRVFIPLASIGALLLDLLVSSLLMFVLMIYFRWPLPGTIIWAPVFALACCLIAGGLGLMLSAWNVRFRDVKYTVPFFLQMGLFLTPVIYPFDYVPGRLRLLMALNPMTGVVIGARHAFLGTPVQWSVVAVSFGVGLALFVAGLFIFRRMEIRFADII